MIYKFWTDFQYAKMQAMFARDGVILFKSELSLDLLQIGTGLLVFLCIHLCWFSLYLLNFGMRSISWYYPFHFASILHSQYLVFFFTISCVDTVWKRRIDIICDSFPVLFQIMESKKDAVNKCFALLVKVVEYDIAFSIPIECRQQHLTQQGLKRIQSTYFTEKSMFLGI